MTCSHSDVPHCRVMPPSEFNVIISEPRATLHGAATWQIQSHVIPKLRGTLQDERIIFAITKSVLRRILFYFCFPNAVWASASGGFRIVFDALVSTWTVVVGQWQQFAHCTVTQTHARLSCSHFAATVAIAFQLENIYWNGRLCRKWRHFEVAWCSDCQPYIQLHLADYFAVFAANSTKGTNISNSGRGR